MKIPFDIKFRPQIESGEYKVVCRKDNYPVTILLWDFKDPEGYNILAYYEDDKGQYPMMYNNKGELYHDKDSLFDLFIITPEPELTEFEQEVCTKSNLCLNLEMVDEIKSASAELLDLARKEIELEIIDQVERDYWRHSADLQRQAREDGKAEALKEIEQDPESSYAFKRGVEYGKEEALKDLPRWRKWANGACGNGRGIPLAIVKRGLNGYELVDALGIQGEQYIMLSDLEKLPGFKEDRL